MKKQQFRVIFNGVIILGTFLLLFLLISDNYKIYSAKGKEAAVHQDLDSIIIIKKLTDDENKNNQAGVIKQETNTKKKQLVNDTIKHKEIVSLTNKFMALLMQKTDNNYQVLQFNSKDELLTAFEEITTRDVAKEYVDFYFTEKDNKLYIVPTETPPWFNEDADYSMKQTGKNKVELKQVNETDLYGKYTIVYEFTYQDKWKITNIKHS